MKIKRLAAVTVAFAVMFTSLPLMTGTFAVHAATGKPGKTKIVDVRAVDLQIGTYVILSWKTVKNAKGYTVYRDGEAIKTLGRNNNFYKETIVTPGRHKYTVRAYAKKTVRKYWNKKKHKWQKKKIAGAKTKKQSEIVWGKTSAAKTVVVKDISSSNSAGGAGSSSTSGNTSGSRTTPTTPAAPVAPGGGTTAKPEVTVQTYECVDYEGTRHTLTKTSGDDYWVSESGNHVRDAGLWRYDKTIDYISPEGYGVQISGARFEIAQITRDGSYDSPSRNGGEYSLSRNHRYFEAYNIDPSKLTVVLDPNVKIETVKSYSWPYLFEKSKGSVSELDEIEHKYIIKDGKYVGVVGNDGLLDIKELMAVGNHYEEVPTDGDGECRIYINVYPGGSYLGYGLLYDADIPVKIYYDGVYVATYTAKSSENCEGRLLSDGMNPERALALSIAQDAIAWGKSEEAKEVYAAYGGVNPRGTGIYADLLDITEYLRNKYTYNQTVEGYGTSFYSMDCQVGAFILETWAVYKYGKEGMGFIAWGTSSYASHVAYHLNSDPGFYQDANGKI